MKKKNEKTRVPELMTFDQYLWSIAWVTAILILVTLGIVGLFTSVECSRYDVDVHYDINFIRGCDYLCLEEHDAQVYLNLTRPLYGDDMDDCIAKCVANLDFDMIIYSVEEEVCRETTRVFNSRTLDYNDRFIEKSKENIFVAIEKSRWSSGHDY